MPAGLSRDDRAEASVALAEKQLKESIARLNAIRPISRENSKIQNFADRWVLVVSALAPRAPLTLWLQNFATTRGDNAVGEPPVVTDVKTPSTPIPVLDRQSLPLPPLELSEPARATAQANEKFIAQNRAPNGLPMSNPKDDVKTGDILFLFNFLHVTAKMRFDKHPDDAARLFLTALNPNAIPSKDRVPSVGPWPRNHGALAVSIHAKTGEAFELDVKMGEMLQESMLGLDHAAEVKDFALQQVLLLTSEDALDYVIAHQHGETGELRYGPSLRITNPEYQSMLWVSAKRMYLATGQQKYQDAYLLSRKFRFKIMNGTTRPGNSKIFRRENRIVRTLKIILKMFAVG